MAPLRHQARQTLGQSAFSLFNMGISQQVHMDPTHPASDPWSETLSAELSFSVFMSCSVGAICWVEAVTFAASSG